MRHKLLRIAATAFVVLLGIIVPAILFVRSQTAQTTQTDGPAQGVLIEKSQIIGRSSVPEIISVPRSPTPLDETTTTLPPRFDSAIRSFERRGIRDAAFSAEVQIETVGPLRDGGTTMRKTTYLVYRDNHGRTRRDLMSDQTKAAATENRPRSSVINDPVASVVYFVDHRTSTARKVPLPSGNDVESESSAVQPNKRGTAPGFINVGAPNSQFAKTDITRERRSSEVKEQLGQREIGGVITKGTRFVRTISIASEKPIEITTEEWYSPDLQTIVAVTISDPRFGQSEYRLVNIIRDEPSPELFAIPQGYKIKDW